MSGATTRALPRHRREALRPPYLRGFELIDIPQPVAELSARRVLTFICRARSPSVGATLLRIHRTASECGLFVPSELTLLGKTLLQLDEIGKVLDPAFDPNLAIRRHAADILSHGLEHGALQGSLLGSLLEKKTTIALR